MSDIKLFNIKNNNITQLEEKSVALEKSLQILIENNLDIFFAIKFLASEYRTGARHQGRIDTLGLDENGYPVIIEYKKAMNQNVINQGLYYLDWLLDHKGEFQLLVTDKLGKDFARKIEWSNPRLLCIAGDFTKYDFYAVEQIDRIIELIRYKKYEEKFLLLELVNTPIDESLKPKKKIQKENKSQPTIDEMLNNAPKKLKDCFNALKNFLCSLGDDVQIKTLKYYFAFKRIKNFACVEINPKSQKLGVYVKVNPETINLEDGFTRDVRNVGHYGTGGLEIIIRSSEDLKKAENYLIQSYESS